MVEDQLRSVIDGMRVRLQAELEAQLGSLAESHNEAIEQVRHAAEEEAEQRYAAALHAARQELGARLESEVAAAREEAEALRDELSATLQSELGAAHAESDAIRAELSERLQSEVAAARSEVERTMVAESMRARVEAEQASADSAAQTRREMEQAVSAERQRAQQLIDAAGQQAQARVEAERQRADREVAEIRRALETERARANEMAEAAQRASPSTNGVPGLLDAIRAVDAAASLSDTLVAAVRGAAREAPRAALFMVNGTHLQEWPVPGLPPVHAGAILPEELDSGLFGEALRRHEPVLSGHGDGPSAPAFASLPPGRMAMAVPFVLGGTPVAILYADEGASGDAPASWPDRVQILGRHTSACLAYLTAMRTAEALRLLSGPSPAAGGPNAGHQPDHADAQGARRYARLLVSEIKLYNESAVRLGRERRDLLQRLKPEIERARRLYDERVAPSIRARDVYFHQELVQTLADGDHSLLG